jgi:hypothetical protein
MSLHWNAIQLPLQPSLTPLTQHSQGAPLLNLHSNEDIQTATHSPTQFDFCWTSAIVIPVAGHCMCGVAALTLRDVSRALVFQQLSKPQKFNFMQTRVYKVLQESLKHAPSVPVSRRTDVPLRTNAQVPQNTRFIGGIMARPQRQIVWD